MDPRAPDSGRPKAQTQSSRPTLPPRDAGSPLHLLALDCYNNRDAPSAAQRLVNVRPVLLPTLLIRIVRQLPAFGIGGVMNTSLVHRGRDRNLHEVRPMPRLSWACARCDRRGHLASQLAAISPASPRRQYYAKPRAATEPDDAGPWAHYGGDPLLTAHRRRVMDTYTARLDGALDLLGEEARPISRQSPRTLPLSTTARPLHLTYSLRRPPLSISPRPGRPRHRRGGRRAARRQAAPRLLGRGGEAGGAAAPLRLGRLRAGAGGLLPRARGARRAQTAGPRDAPARHVGRAPQGLATCVFPSPAQALQPHSSPLAGLLGDGRDVPDVDQDLVAKLQRLNSVEANQSA